MFASDAKLILSLSLNIHLPCDHQLRLHNIFFEKEEKWALFMKRILNLQHMISCKGVLLRIDWWIINLLLVSGLQEDGPG